MSIQEIPQPEPLFHHLFDPMRGYLFTASLDQGRRIPWEQLPWRYPEQAQSAADWAETQAQLGRETYFGTHLYRTPQNRQASNSSPTVHALWCDLDHGTYPEDGPQPTAIIRSSYQRWHLYWRLTHPIAIEWAVDLNKRIVAFCGGDSTKAGASSVLRPPGSCNFKRERADLVVGYLTGADALAPEVMDQAIPLPQPESGGSGGRVYGGPAIELAPYLEQVQVLGVAPDNGAEVKFRIVCPWAAEHSGGDTSGTYLMRFPSGAPHFKCNHEHCSGRGWREFRNEIVRRSRGTEARVGDDTIRLEVIRSG